MVHCGRPGESSGRPGRAGRPGLGGCGNSTDVQSLFNVNNNDSIHSAIPAGGNFGFIGGVARFGVSF